MKRSTPARFRTWSVGLAISAVLLVLLPAAAEAAQCNQGSDRLSTADSDWWAVHGCQSSYYLWQYLAYHTDSGWPGSGNGFESACTKRMNYPKFWSASYLVNYGLSDNWDYCFHFSQSDYRPLAEGGSSNFHESNEYFAPENLSGGAFGAWYYDYAPGSDNNIHLGCPLFDKTLSVNANPASRAGDFMHESWHGYEDKWDWDINCNAGHRCKSGACTVNSCDYWHWHTISVYAPGQLYQNKTSGNPSHRPNQVQVEFLCDVNQYPAANVPASVRNAAKSDANTRAAQRFINGPGYKCGDPRPW
jgi:hypothetical protein